MTQTRDPVTGQIFDDGEGRVSLGGVTTAVSGTKKLIILDPDNADAADAASERYESVAGVKAYRIIPKNTGVASCTGIIFAHSTTAGELAAINTAMGTVSTDYTTPAGKGSAYDDVGILIPTENGAATDQLSWYGDTDWQVYDGTNLIKIIAVRSIGADYTVGVVLEVIE